ncbi:MAG: hypothetical protein ACP5RD_08470, partial [bacterium]
SLKDDGCFFEKSNVYSFKFNSGLIVDWHPTIGIICIDFLDRKDFKNFWIKAPSGVIYHEIQEFNSLDEFENDFKDWKYKVHYYGCLAMLYQLGHICSKMGFSLEFLKMKVIKCIG